MVYWYFQRENGKVFFWKFFGHLQQILRQADLSLFMSGHVFVISISDSFHKYFVLFCSAKLVIMRLNGGYKSRFDVILPNQPYWNHHCFLSAWGGLLQFISV